MLTEVFKVDKDNPDISEIKRAARIIKNGGLVAFPTETVYGLGADAKDPLASSKIYAAKGRPSDNPLIVHISEFDDIKTITKGDLRRAKILSDRFWPGPLTIILKKNNIIPEQTTGGLDTVAIRMPDEKVALSLIKESGTVIAAPSANVSGRPSPTCAEHVIEDFDGIIDGIIDDGYSRIGLESTIIDLSNKIPTVLRSGYYSSESLQEALGEQVIDVSGKTVEDTPRAPGMKYRHYAPKGRLILVKGKRTDIPPAILSMIKDDYSKNIAIITCRENENAYLGMKTYILGSEKNGEEIMNNLYSTLRQLDTDKVELCYCEDFENVEYGKAITERLEKACGGNIFKIRNES